jgi:hypothetical protein
MVMRDTVDTSWALQTWAGATVVSECGLFRTLRRAAAAAHVPAEGLHPVLTSAVCGVAGTGEVEGVHEVIRWH